jgi:hypothetical protein
MSRSDRTLITVLALLGLAVVAVGSLLVFSVVRAPVWMDVVVLTALLIAALSGAYGWFVLNPGPKRREDDESE